MIMQSELVSSSASNSKQHSICMKEGEEAPVVVTHRKLKTSCEGCTQLKLKCSSTTPSCDRCLQRGIPCIYVEERRRGRPSKVKCLEESEIRRKIVLKIMSHVNTSNLQARTAYDIVSPLSIVTQKRMIAAFFLNYFPDDPKMTNFFSNHEITEQCRKLLRFMHLHGHRAALDLTQDFLKIHDICMDDYSDVLSSPRVPLIRSEHTRSLSNEFQSWKPSSGEISFVLDTLNDQLKVKVSPEFSQVFGYTSRDLNYLLEYCIGGLLPWGGDLMSILLAEDDECIVRYLLRVKTEILSHQDRANFEAFPQAMQILNNRDSNSLSGNMMIKGESSCNAACATPSELEVITFSYPCHLSTKNGEKVSCECIFTCRSPKCFNRSKIQVQVSIGSFAVCPNDNTLSPKALDYIPNLTYSRDHENKQAHSLANAFVKPLTAGQVNSKPAPPTSNNSNILIYPTSFKEDEEPESMELDLANNEWLNVLVEDWKRDQMQDEEHLHP